MIFIRFQLKNDLGIIIDEDENTRYNLDDFEDCEYLVALLNELNTDSIKARKYLRKISIKNDKLEQANNEMKKRLQYYEECYPPIKE